jgi:hypothetical protein
MKYQLMDFKESIFNNIFKIHHKPGIMNKRPDSPVFPVNSWWYKPYIQEDLKETIRLFQEYRSSLVCEKCLKFDRQFDAVAALLMTFKKAVFNVKVSDLVCICTLIDQGISSDRKSRLIKSIDRIGYEKIRSAFEILLRVCEDQIHEKEDLFGILKRHRLHFPEPGSNEEKLYRIGQFLNMSLINQNLMKKNGHQPLTESLMRMKYDASLVLMPLIEEIFVSVFGEQILPEEA